MIGRIPDLKKLRRIIENSNTKINSGRSISIPPSASLDYPQRSKSPPSLDFQLIGQAQKQIADLTKQISNRTLESQGDMQFSISGVSPFQLTLASELPSKRSQENLSKSILNQLQSANLKIRVLEESNKQKQRRIEQMKQKILHEKAKVEGLKKQLVNFSGILKQKNSSALKLRSKEKELQRQKIVRKLKDQKKKQGEMKRSIYRLQDLNNSLIEKVKSLEIQKENIETKVLQKLGRKEKERALKVDKKCLIKENKILKIQIEEACSKLGKLRKKYGILIKNSLQFQEKTRELYTVNQLLHSNLINLIPQDN